MVPQPQREAPHRNFGPQVLFRMESDVSADKKQSMGAESLGEVRRMEVSGLFFACLPHGSPHDHDSQAFIPAHLCATPAASPVSGGGP